MMMLSQAFIVAWLFNLWIRLENERRELIRYGAWHIRPLRLRLPWVVGGDLALTTAVYLLLRWS